MLTIFIAIKVPGDQDGRAEIAQSITKAIIASGHTPFLAYQEINRLGLTSGTDFMPFIWQRLRQCELLVVAYDQELRGGLIEAGMAYALGIPIWVLHRAGEVVSRSMQGCASRVLDYQNRPDLESQLAIALAQFEPGSLQKMIMEGKG